ncbi:Midasin [Moelleriella libera RCEF 2490]|uniref:Midasin n=1 Tax=Moelleriella libera RCEF 2490 TaxID=1081109 RepID=A0A166USC1_9HYPO|nr:Midasin [Moelleriella libera RCEF 2490]
MTTIDVSRQTKSLLEDATVREHLPSELYDSIQQDSTAKLLDALSQAALCSQLTEHVFVHLENVFPDICARWIISAGAQVAPAVRIRIASSIARLLPFAPCLASFIQCAGDGNEAEKQPSPAQLLLPQFDDASLSSLDAPSILESLVTLWRLLNFDLRTYSRIASMSYMQMLFQHESPPVRYVAIRIFCLLLHASDLKLETLIHKHVGIDESVMGSIDGVSMDFTFLSLYEQDRARKVITLQHELQNPKQEEEVKSRCLQSLTPYAIAYGDIVLPRPNGMVAHPSTVVMTSTTTQNLERLAASLRTEDPVLLYGSAGVGKTTFIHEIATQLGKQSDMVALHLNEQTDAKMLIGLYSTDTKPGSFQWRPGVLTTAVREGRWVLVEDLDRAPTEVLSTLLPLIERRELLIPSRGERIRAANGFRLFATIRTSRGMNGQENLPSFVGMRFWQKICAKPLPASELEQVVTKTFPMLRKFVPGILAVHARLSQLGGNLRLVSRGRGVMDRQVNLRDLLKWCQRLKECLLTAGSISGNEPISESTRDWMFMEALDCFVGSCPDVEISKHLTYSIAEEMHMSKDRADHYMAANIPPLDENERVFNIGRAQLTKKKSLSRLRKSKRPFASTAHAKRLLEQIAVAVKLKEPVLLVGETGIGKTTVVQQLADSLGHKLIAVNLSQQSEAGDLLGGFKPVNVRSLAVPLKEEFEDLFAATGISATKNQKYLEQIGKCFAKSQWPRVSRLWKEAPKMFGKIVSDLRRLQADQAVAHTGEEQPTKRRKTQSKLESLLELQPRWDAFAQKLEQFEVQSSGGSGAFAFSFVEGNLVKAVRNGDWVLLDEINLASADTLESIADLLTSPGETPSILLSETGEIEKIVAHPSFRIFGAMNPATDVGKRDLPIGIRSRFTELYVRSPDNDLKDLLTIIKAYMGDGSTKNDQAADDIARLYLNTKRMTEEKRLVDGANEVPHFSLRTLTRVLSYVKSISPSYGVRRALYEGFSMGFLTLLNRESEKLLLPLIYHHLLDKHGNPQSLLSQPPKHPNDGRQYVKFQNRNRDRYYWLFQGNEIPVQREDYIITPYVERNLLNLVRATSTRRFPVLIQGPTSAGKTSMIEYLAEFTGNKFVRINNHEHTDLQEYLGTYVSGPDGKLRFQEGLLVQAMRQGHWIVLDELNLAPTDVLEALNRLLDDNRELLIPETQEVVRPHENFILFATQNPPGLYGGRKVLSRAFRNRFLELHFDDIPEDELEFILQHRSRNTSPPDCRRIVAVYKELSRLRQTSRLFEQKDSFATLRDLFRWALRTADTREEIAAHGFMLLAERVRVEEERLAVKEVVEKIFKVKIDPHELYSASKAPELKHLANRQSSQGVVLTHAMRRLYVLVSRALQNNEPVLLVGETGCGKTTVVQVLAEALGQKLHIVNAHQNTETGDLIGSQRPVRNRGAILDALDAQLTTTLASLGQNIPADLEAKLEKYHDLDSSIKARVPQVIHDRIMGHAAKSKALFEWSDGALVEAMRSGNFFLLDEISLADDSVLERLNSVLEPRKTLLLAEKGVDNSFIVGAEGFQFFATMNPGGDFGKRELSPALRNRFTEIWVPPLSESEDIYDIVQAKLEDGSKHLADAMVKFAHWFAQTFRSMASSSFSVREILVWVQFINMFQARDPVAAFVHGAAAIFVDSIGANPSAVLATDRNTVINQRQECLKKLGDLAGQDVSRMYMEEPDLTLTDDLLSIGEFSTPRDRSHAANPTFAFHAPTTRSTVMRVVRALQMQKPILLEGSPGVGKTTLVAALAQACGRPLTRINLSDQTDLMDLFGTDVPVEGEGAGHFAWRDAPFLQAMQTGEWVLLDEMNLASQSVLEGLNACLDHRGEVYVSELDQVFKRHPDFRLFAAQNPHHQGGGRKGLPASFVNRFIVVYADVFKDEDLKLIASHDFPNVSSEIIAHLVEFVSKIEHQIVVEKSFGLQGGPWEFNLRDVLRWLRLLSSADPLLATARLDDFLDIIVKQRFRTTRDRAEAEKLFTSVVGWEPQTRSLYHDLSSRFGQVGFGLLPRNSDVQPEVLPNIDVVVRLAELESIIVCINQNIPCILSGPSGYGKSALLSYVAAVAGKPLVIFPMNADIDTMDLVGGFEQADPLREVNAALVELADYLKGSVMSLVPSVAPTEVLHLLHMLSGHNDDHQKLPGILSALQSLLDRVASDSEASVKLINVKRLLEAPLQLSNPRFEWLDGVIVKALLTGQWLVLDNANMCNASVLDRLNSLLEPNGSLDINEHSDTEGRPRIIRPHPDFRIFLTMDPRYGELSRAMRNRAVEIHIVSPPPALSPCFDKVSAVEGPRQRFHLLQVSTEDVMSKKVAEAAVEHLSLGDLALLPRFIDQCPKHAGRPGFVTAAEELLGFLQTSPGSQLLQNIVQLYSTLPAEVTFGNDGTQCIHMLNNETFAKMLSNEVIAAWMGERLERSWHLHRLRQEMHLQERKAQSTRLASLNRLQRSLISARVAAVSKDSTVMLGAFLSSILAATEMYLTQDIESKKNFFIRLQLLNFLEQFLQQTIALTSGTDFDDAYFQAHITLGKKRLQVFGQSTQTQSDGAYVSSVFDDLSRNFNSGFQLSSGLSMEPLWYMFRPTPIASQAGFERSVELDQLARRFDAIRWRASSSIFNLSEAQRALLKAYHIIRDDTLPGDDLLKGLATAIDTLERRIGLTAQETVPVFTKEFEYLRQVLMLKSWTNGPIDSERHGQLIVMSNIPTKAAMTLDSPARKASSLQLLADMASSKLFHWDGKLNIALWNNLRGLNGISLGSMSLLEAELPIIGQHLATLAPQVASEPLKPLNALLEDILLDTLGAHGSNIRAAMVDCLTKLKTDTAALSMMAPKFATQNPVFNDLKQAVEVPHLQEVLFQHLIPAAVEIIAAQAETVHTARHSAMAWLHFSIGIVKLYTPDKVFDPQLQPKAEAEFHSKLESSLLEKLAALRSFQIGFSGQSSSARISLLELQLGQLGPSPEAMQSIFRPEKSELTQIHAEFANVLKTVTGPTLQALLTQPNPLSNSENTDGLKLVQENILRLTDRLSSRHEAYQDMTRPAVNMLHCLLVGLSLCDAARAEAPKPSTLHLLNMTPYSASSYSDASPDDSRSNSFEFLHLMSAHVAVNGFQGLASIDREAVFACFHAFFEEWTRKLDADRKAEAAKTSMYRFRGTLEDEEEIDAAEFDELFPTFDEEKSSGRTAKGPEQARGLSLRVAEAHRKIFLERQEPSVALRDSCMAVSQRVATELQDSANVDRTINGKMLPSILLLLSEKMEAMQKQVSSKEYNFYTDTNLVESRQLVTLMQKIKARFRELQLVDEIGHMQTLADVIQACDKILEQVYSDPLAKILPKVEQLHAHVYEWQFGGWASKTYAVLPIHNLLTDTVIRWRRLELSTWGNLFGMEQKKCHDDAYSWWFIAYQVVIAVPLTMMDSPSKLKDYAKSLIESLETYFTTSIVGQFRTRLSLLRQLLNHLYSLAENYPALEIICTAVDSFLRYFSRYEKVADDAIQKGRLPIDKKMRDVLLMASWKDTNINALRESARKSHQKLFRLVRKFRGVLGQEMGLFISQGLPDENISALSAHEPESILSKTPAVDVEHIANLLPGWLENHKRLANQWKTVSIIKKITSSPETSSNAAESIVDFVNDLTTSMVELRKETPSVLNDETKSQVKHLKTRKRKLFADTLRDLRAMGLQFNLSQDRLAHQNSLAIILSRLATADSSASKTPGEAEYFLHKTLELVPRAREAAREHSEDLTSAEVTRSVGFVEGLLHLTLAQHQRLGAASTAFKSLQKAVDQFRCLGDISRNGPLARRTSSCDWPRVLSWLHHATDFSLKIIQNQAQLGSIDNGSVTESLELWKTRVTMHSSAAANLANLPQSVSSVNYQKLEQSIMEDVAEFGRDLGQVMEARPDLSFILKHLRVCTEVELGITGEWQENVHPGVLAEAVAKLSDTVLVAIEGVQKIGTAVPRDQNEPGWLIRHGDGVASMVDHLHLKDIEGLTRDCIGLVQRIRLNDSQNSLAAMGVISLASPILDQFLSLCQHCISQVRHLHRATAYMAYTLTKSFNQIASQGFCTPQEKSDESSGDAGKLEAGTGLGDGEGAEDISKDIQADEDLTELAQEANKEQNGDVEDEKDAVDMADEDLEGEMGSVAGEEEEGEGSRKGDDKDEAEDDMDEEAGEVDDLDPTAVDEKMWDGENDEKAEKEQQGNETRGRKQEDEQMAAEENAKQKKENQELEDNEDGAQPKEDEGQGEDEEDDQAAPEELNRQDQHVQENDALDLPDEMELDFDEDKVESDSDGIDDLSDAEDGSDDAEERPTGKEEDDEEVDDPSTQQPRTEADMESEMSEDETDEAGDETLTGADEVQEEVKEDPDDDDDDDDNSGEERKEEEAQDKANPPPDNANADVDNAAPSDVKSSGLDDEEQRMDVDDPFKAQAAEQDSGDLGDGAADQDASAGSKGTASRSNEMVDRGQEEDEAKEAAASDPFRKLGDALEKWHRQNADILDAKQDDAPSSKEADKSEAEEQGRREYQHVQHDEDAADDQAMGTAREDELQRIDDTMAIDDEDQQDKAAADATNHVMEADADDEAERETDTTTDAADAAEEGETNTNESDKRTGVQTRQGNYDREQTPPGGEDERATVAGQVEDGPVEETSEQLSTTHISDEAGGLRDYAECLEQWSEFQSKSHALSLSLTSQLRLILTPSQSTKLSGSFRTGKRLNIKRIIPYIASSYKRDKIWMRRAVPTKRRYQILLCVDDSKSMGESSSGRLAMESLVMVSRALTMLEAGQVGVVGFGADVMTAHELTEPFASDAGARVLQRFSFGQDRTDVALLIRQTIDKFRTAKQQQQQQSQSGAADLWQLALILSDGLTPSASHDAIRRLLREAMEERIMIVFIIMDDTGNRKGDSVLELKEAKFVRDDDGESSRVVIERYLDTFPFQYYLIVHNLEELPTALAGLLRTWFAEVAA